MHMANELLSVPIAVGAIGIASGALWAVCKQAGQAVTSEKFAMMGILGAFVFAGQMVNFQLPGMPGTSGHIVGAVMLAIILGPHAGTIVIASVVIVQCLIFQDGGLLALGCNIINMAVVPSYVGYLLYKAVSKGSPGSARVYIATMLACLLAVETGAVLVPIQAGLSGVLAVPFSTFLVTMVGVHLIVALIEGLITVAVLGYLQQVRCDIVDGLLPGKIRLSKGAVLATLAVFAVIIGGGVSLLASDMPDGLEWSYADRPNQPDFQGFVANDNAVIDAIDDFQGRYSLLPDYSIRASLTENADVSVGWTSFAGVVGSMITMALIWLLAKGLRKKATKHA